MSAAATITWRKRPGYERRRFDPAHRYAGETPMLHHTRPAPYALAILLLLAAHVAARAQDVARLPLENSDFPISAAVTVRAGADLAFLSGTLPPVIDKTASKGSGAAYGDTETQTVGAITLIKATLARLGMGLGDVIKMNVYMVADPAQGGKLDFAGLMAGYTKFFGTKDQPNKPARSAVQVAALVVPGPLVEIEVIAAKPH
jgi:enamine deaminase RidA (YjgF/YER057c/UK114 family)